MIPLTLLDVHISAPHPLDFGANPGSTIRGALYAALRAMYDDGSPACSRADMESNPVAWLLRLEDEETSGGKDVPRPLAVQPPLTPPAQTMIFGLSLYGRGREQLSLLLSALHAMQSLGLGRGRSLFSLDQVNAVDPLYFQASPLLDGRGRQLGEVCQSPGATAYEALAQALVSDRLTVNFLTPTRIVDHGRLCHVPEFTPWLKRLLERTRTISELYMDMPVWVPFKQLLSDAENVHIEQDDTRWIEMWSGSRRDGRMRPTSGFVGRVTYGGDFRCLLPWLLLGQALQVGKNTVKGCGWYRIIYEWQ